MSDATHAKADSFRLRAFPRQLNPELLAALLLAAPALIFLAVLFLYPMLSLFAESLAGGNLGNYQRIATAPVYVAVFLNTLKIAAIVTVVDLLIAFPLCLYMRGASPSARMTAFFFVLLPLWTSQLVRTYAWMVLLGRNGPINAFLQSIGIFSEPVNLLNSEFAVVIGMVHILLPFMVLPLWSAVERIDQALVDAAQGMGASRLSVLRRILLPLTVQGIMAGVALVFTLSVGVFIMPALLGGGRVPVVPLLIEQQTTRFLNWPFAGALSAVLLAVVLLTFWLLNIVIRRITVTRRPT